MGLLCVCPVLPRPSLGSQAAVARQVPSLLLADYCCRRGTLGVAGKVALLAASR
jgi:hypothetical protein